MRWGRIPIYTSASEERRLLTHTRSASVEFTVDTRGTRCKREVMSNCFVSAGIRPVSLHRRGDGLGARILPAGETQ